VLNCRILNVVILLMMIIPTSAVSDAKSVHFSRSADTRIRGILEEIDPGDSGDCFALGELEIVYRAGNNGLPIGVVLTDPRGRQIGFDPLTKRAWDALPLAQGYIDCDDLGDADGCRGVVQVCGPISGTYKLEIIAQQTTAYSVSISARSKEVFDGNSLRSCHSESALKNVAIRERSRDIVFLNYSRYPQ
jgi:hypothetical protein